MAGIVMMLLGIVILGAVGVYVIVRDIRRLVELRRARLTRVNQLERQVKELIERVRQLEGLLELDRQHRLQASPHITGRYLTTTKALCIDNAID